MDISQVDESLRAATRRAPKLNLENPAVLRLVSALASLAPGTRVDGVERRTVRVGDLRLRVYTPQAPSGAGLLWVHGGGLVIGSAALDDRFCGETARDTAATVVSVDYRLAPRHPFPAGLDDAHTGWRWLADHAASLGLDPDRLAIGGQSAGAGLAACLAQRLHDEGARVALQWLFCPMLDDRTAMDRARDAERHFVWDNRANLVGWSSYLGDRIGAADLPPYAAAARRADLTGLPTTWMYTSDIELFHDEDVAYARRLEQAGVDVTLDVISGAPHGVESWAQDSAIARDLVRRSRDWLAARLG